MPVLELLTILAAVGSIISGFAATKEIFGRLWRTISGKARDGNQFTQQLMEASRGINHRYDAGVASLGQRFAQGDEQARLNITRVLTDMNSKLISQIQGVQVNATKAQAFCKHLGEVVQGLRTDTIDCLNGLAQRIQVAKPIHNPISHRYSYGASSRTSSTDTFDRLSSCNWALVPRQLGSTESLCSSSASSVSRYAYDSPKIQLSPISAPPQSASSLERTLSKTAVNSASTLRSWDLQSSSTSSDEVFAANLKALQML